MTLGWVLGWYCGLPNEGRRPADCRSEYRPGPRRYMLQSRRESPSTVPAVYAAKPPGVPSTASRLVLFLSGSLCWDQSSILEIIRLPGNPTRVRTLRGAGRPGRQRTCPLRQLQERALKRHASVLVSVAVTSVTSCPSSTHHFFWTLCEAL